MTPSHQETYDWYDDVASLEATRAPAKALPGVPDFFMNFGWWISSFAYSALWMLDSWTVASPGNRLIGELAEGFWALLLALGICYGTYRFSKAYSKPLAQTLCMISAVVLLLNHAAGS